MIHAVVVSIVGTVNDLKGKAVTGGGQEFDFTNHGYRAVESNPEHAPVLPERANRRMFRKPRIKDNILIIPGDNGCAAKWTFSEAWTQKREAYNKTL